MQRNLIIRICLCAGACVCVGEHVALCQLPPLLRVALPFCLILRVNICETDVVQVALNQHKLYVFLRYLTRVLPGDDVCSLANRCAAIDCYLAFSRFFLLFY